MATNTNKKPSPATKPTPAKPAAPAAKPTTSDDLDDDLDTDAPKGSFNKLPMAKRIAVRIGNEVTRLSRHSEDVGGWQKDNVGLVQRAKERLAEAVDALKSAAEALALLPDDYKPRASKAGGGSKVDLLPGALIRITDKRVGEYEGVLEPAQMRGIKVVEVRGNKVIALTNDGVKAMFARGHVCPDGN